MSVDENGGNAEKLRVLMAALAPAERRFIDQVLRGQPHEIAAQNAGFRSRLAAQDLLGRPRVARALQRAASYLPPAQAYAALRPLLTAKLVDSALAGGAAGISASRDLRAMADGQDKGQDLAKEWEKRKAARKAAQREGFEARQAGAEPSLAPTVNPRDPTGLDS